jgi:hypothetical protein
VPAWSYADGYERWVAAGGHRPGEGGNVGFACFTYAGDDDSVHGVKKPVCVLRIDFGFSGHKRFLILSFERFTRLFPFLYAHLVKNNWMGLRRSVLSKLLIHLAS